MCLLYMRFTDKDTNRPTWWDLVSYRPTVALIKSRVDWTARTRWVIANTHSHKQVLIRLIRVKVIGFIWADVPLFISVIVDWISVIGVSCSEVILINSKRRMWTSGFVLLFAGGFNIYCNFKLGFANTWMYFGIGIPWLPSAEQWKDGNLHKNTHEQRKRKEGTTKQLSFIITGGGDPLVFS